jgi:Spy/CpxP family protein refolding chaperone
MRPLFAITLAALLIPATVVSQEPPQGPPMGLRRAAPMTRQRGPMGPQGFRGMGPGGLAFGAQAFAPRVLLNRREQLALTDDQAKQLEALAGELDQARDKMTTEQQAHREKMRALWTAEKIDVTALQAEARAGMQAAQAMELQTITNIAKAKALLTAEQRGRVEGWADSQRWGMRRSGRGPAGAMGRGPAMGMRGRMRRF